MDDDQIIDTIAAQALQADVARTRSLYGWAVWHYGGMRPTIQGKVIARLVLEQPTSYVLVANSLANLQAMLPRSLERADRRPCDLPELVEIWLAA